jgi:histidinol phosphatase-like enzyme (inositol monophosphatase family)
MSNTELAGLADFACTLADAARAVTLPAARLVQEIENKAAGGAFDPVTAADRAAEKSIRALIAAHHPDHGVDGEEFGSTPGAGRFTWSLDPIDGTRAFICGLPGWTTLIALLEEASPVIGLIDAPIVGERYLGDSAGSRLIGSGGTFALRVSGCRSLAEARLATTDPYLFDGADAGAFDRLRRAARVTRYGFDAYAYARLAAGGIDLVAETGLKPHDYHALVPVIRGAGGVVGNWRGDDDLSGGDVLAAATRDLFEAAVVTLARR